MRQRGRPGTILLLVSFALHARLLALGSVPGEASDTAAARRRRYRVLALTEDGLLGEALEASVAGR